MKKDFLQKNAVALPNAANNPAIIEENKDFAANLGWLVFSGAVSVANSVLIWIFMARWREPAELGRFTIIMGLYALFYNVCSFNIGPLLVREISRRAETKGQNKLPEFIGSSLAFLSISGTFCALLMAAGGMFFHTTESQTANAVLSLALIPTALIVLGEANALAEGRGKLIAGVTTLENSLRTIIPLFLILFDYSLTVICLSFLAVRIAAALIYWIANRVKNVSFSSNELKFLFKSAPTYAGTIIFSSLNWQIPVILLAYFAAEEESAHYGVASRFLVPAMILAVSFANAFQPALVREWEKSAAAGVRYLRRKITPIIALTIACAVLSPFLSGGVLGFLFGEKYADANNILNMLAISVVPFTLVMLTARGLVVANAAGVDLLANAIGAGVCFAACIFLVPQYGATGAAGAQIISFALMAVIEITYLLILTNNAAEEKNARGWAWL